MQVGWFFPRTARRGNAARRRCCRSKGIFSFQREHPPLEPPEKGKGSYPLTPHIGSFYLEELHALRIAQPLAALLPYGCATADDRSRGKSYSNANAALPRAGIPIPEAKGLFKPETATLTAFLLDGNTARFLSRERKWGVCSCRPQAAFSSAPVWNYHRSSSSNFIIPSSCSRICAFIGPSSRWS